MAAGTCCVSKVYFASLKFPLIKLLVCECSMAYSKNLLNSFFTII